MRARDGRLAESINGALAAYESVVGPLPGIDLPDHRSSFVRQLVDSLRRNLYVMHIVEADLSPSRCDPTSGKFDPLKAAVLFNRSAEYDEAFWMLFLFVHFGRHRVARWRYAANVYGRVGDEGRWDWASVSSDVDGFRYWLDENVALVRGTSPHGFGNHRKYESLSGWSDVGTGAVVASYLDWVGPSCTHIPLFEAGRASLGSDASAVYRRVVQVDDFSSTVWADRSV